MYYPSPIPEKITSPNPPGAYLGVGDVLSIKKFIKHTKNEVRSSFFCLHNYVLVLSHSRKNHLPKPFRGVRKPSHSGYIHMAFHQNVFFDIWTLLTPVIFIWLISRMYYLMYYKGITYCERLAMVLNSNNYIIVSQCL